MTNLVTSERLIDIEFRARKLVTATTVSLAAPGRRSVLRRSLGRPLEHPSVHRTHGLVAQYLPEFPDVPPHSAAEHDVVAIERAFYTVAALIAAQPRDAREEDRARAAEKNRALAPSLATDADTAPPYTTKSPSSKKLWYQRESLGQALAVAVRDGRFNGETTPSRLHVLCRQNVDGVHRHLPRLVGHLRSDVVEVDWVRLAVDLARWGRYSDQVAKNWLQDYYRTLAAPKPAKAAASTTSTTVSAGAAGDPESEQS